jgi:predicted transglutaminase-like cysteine proteinase
MRTQSEVPIRVFPLAKNDVGIAQTVMTMQQLIDSGARNPDVRAQAVDIVRQAGVVPRDSRGEVNAIFAWVKHNFRFTKDPAGKETLGTPQYLMKLKAGDCDDYVVMLGALLTALGYPVRIVTIAADPHEPKRFSHVYMRVFVNGAWVGLDGTQPNSVPGWEPPRYFRQKEWGTMLRNRSAGMGSYGRVARRNPGRSGLGRSFNLDTFESVWSDIGKPLTSLAQAGASRIAYGQIPLYSSAYGYGSGIAPGVTGSGGFTIGTTPGATNLQTLLPWIIGAGAIVYLISRR